MKPTGYDSPITPLECDRNLCLVNEYNGVSCEECIETRRKQEIILTQSDPMKVIPPADGRVICNDLGTAFMSAKTASELLALQHTDCCADGSYRRGQIDTVEKVLEILDRYGMLWWYNPQIDYYVSVGNEIREAVMALKGEEQG